MRTDQPEPGDTGVPDAGVPDAGAPRAADAGHVSSPSAARDERPEPDPVPSRAEQLAVHISYRETVAAREQAASDRAAWPEAVPGLRAAWEAHKQRYPEPIRAEPRTGADGGWSCGEHRRLDPEQNTEAGKAHADLADEASRYILPALRRVEAADPERKLAGLEHMVKGEDRLKEKLADELAGKEKTVREALNEIPDGVRFTLCYDSQRYAEGVLADVDRLKVEGFALVKLKNLWTADQYKGVNSQWRVPDTSSRFEMQFHTPESLEAKELTHKAYERIRGADVTPAERSEARAFQREVNAQLSVPPGTDRIKDYPEKADD
jgi:hypothetical protein